MFSTGHIIFIVISILIITVGICLYRKYNVSFERMLNICLLVCILSEIIKVFSVIKIEPILYPVIQNGEIFYDSSGAYTPYLRIVDLPFELCSLNIILLIILHFTQNEKFKDVLTSILYTTCLIGGTLGIVLSSIAPYITDLFSFATSIRTWQFFIYHSMLVIYGIYLYENKKYPIKFENIKYVFLFLIILDFLSLYVNSVFINPIYVNGNELIGVRNQVNFFSSYNNPLKIPMKTKSEWLIYVAIKYIIGSFVILMAFIPFRSKNKSK